MKQINGTLQAWLTGGTSLSDFDFEDITDNSLATIEYYNGDMSEHGWLLVGSADITVTFHDEDEVLGRQVALLTAAKAKILAKATADATRIEEKIQSLLALPAPKPIVGEIDDDFPF